MVPRRRSPTHAILARALVWSSLLLWGPACETEDERPPAASRPAPEPALLDRVPSFELEDQFGTRHRYEGLSPTPVALFVSGRDAADTNLEWDRWITPRFGESLQVLRVLDLSDVPGLFRSVAVSFVKDRAQPPETPILLDWQGTLLGRLGLTGDTSNLLVVDRAGSIALRVSGPPEPEATSRVESTLQGLLPDPE